MELTPVFIRDIRVNKLTLRKMQEIDHFKSQKNKDGDNQSMLPTPIKSRKMHIKSILFRDGFEITKFKLIFILLDTKASFKPCPLALI